MITYKDIKKTINTQLEDQFNIEINSSDVAEGFNRPSFFVLLDNPTHSATVTQIEKLLTIRIYYFPTDRYDYSLEVLDIQERLERMFELKLPVLDRQFNIHQATSTLTDGVLEFSFDIEYSDVKVAFPDVDNKYINEDGEYIDENGNPILDSEGNLIKVEVMKTFDLKGVK